MVFHPNVIIILLSAIVILSYLFSMLSKAFNIPSVLLLIGVGIAIKYLGRYYGYVEQDVDKLVKILGAIGLIMIVLEAALDLTINRSKLKLISNSFFSALCIFLVSMYSISWMIHTWLNVPIQQCLLYAIPMSIISSAIVIPSTEHLPEQKKEFIVYESSFSDVIGIMTFNYIALNDVLTAQTTFHFIGNIALAIIISAVASILMTYILSKIAVNLKFFLVFAILSLIYALGDSIHLPSLLIVLVFGLLLNNSKSIFIGKFRRLIAYDNMDNILMMMRSITAETSFLIRTFFFILFGYTIDLPSLILPSVWELGTVIVLLLLAVRFIYLRLILKANLFPELFLMPRGLVTILLFYSIPASRQLQGFNKGVLFFVVTLTSLIMMMGLLFFRKDKTLGADVESAEAG
ncbi:MAG: cation:proton antiporter [Taibaiella sp.]|nr:cation:proton antiporter [Taibaiella sp.]